MKVHVDIQACSGHARCWDAAPELYRLNDEGYNESDATEIGPDRVAEASRGALACPERAIRLVDETGAEVGETDLVAYAGLPAARA
ncbi:ferredoxin [Nocardioides sp. cx-173]|uniref:ferredoxin n=1 Tax=Nocardioides sp. cx-173 TaxID=2898796 RepID=UPI001E2EFC73|nr:ferredoxin [Nocardioides sp. cx-173]MCD4524221.1 ferredoxin [Nocardioides sp. cx-173]UGB41613.1 ferredoxin [Nocardioides sp. cx-173]